MSFMAGEQLVRTHSLCTGEQRGGSRTRPPIFWGGVILVSIVLVMTGSWAVRRYGLAALRGIAGAPPRLEVYGEVPAFSLTERNGGRVSRENLLGTVWIADFIFTRCLATCPQQTATMAQLQSQLAFEPDLRLVSITVDPDFDTPEILRRYASRGRSGRSTSLPKRAFTWRRPSTKLRRPHRSPEPFLASPATLSLDRRTVLRRPPHPPIRRPAWCTMSGLLSWIAGPGFVDTTPAWTRRPSPACARTFGPCSHTRSDG